MIKGLSHQEDITILSILNMITKFQIMKQKLREIKEEIDTTIIVGDF